MGRSGKELARRAHTPTTLPTAPPQAARVVFTSAEHAPQYTVSHTWFGDFALHWNADALRGLFCVTDFPAEWVAYVQAAFCGAWREGFHDLGDARPFSAVAWELSDWERAIGPFSAAPPTHWLPRDPVWATVQEEAAPSPRPPKRGDIPWIRSLTLPSIGEGTASE